MLPHRARLGGRAVAVEEIVIRTQKIHDQTLIAAVSARGISVGADYDAVRQCCFPSGSWGGSAFTAEVSDTDISKDTGKFTRRGSQHPSRAVVTTLKGLGTSSGTGAALAHLAAEVPLLVTRNMTAFYSGCAQKYLEQHRPALRERPVSPPREFQTAHNGLCASAY